MRDIEWKKVHYVAMNMYYSIIFCLESNKHVHVRVHVFEYHLCCTCTVAAVCGATFVLQLYSFVFSFARSYPSVYQM